MTMKEFLDMPKPEQATEAAKWLTPKPWKHGLAGDTSFDETVACPKCDKLMFDCRDKTTLSWWTDDVNTDCTVPDPIKIDWNTAKRLQGECDEHSWHQALVALFDEITRFDARISTCLPSRWGMFLADPIHYLAAAMACKGAFNENHE